MNVHLLIMILFQTSTKILNLSLFVFCYTGNKFQLHLLYILIKGLSYFI